MSDQENKDPDAPVVAFLTTILDARNLDRPDQKFRVDAGIAILAYLSKWKGAPEAVTLRAHVKETMRRVALNDDLPIDVRIRAAGVAL